MKKIIFTFALCAAPMAALASCPDAQVMCKDGMVYGKLAQSGKIMCTPMGGETPAGKAPDRIASARKACAAHGGILEEATGTFSTGIDGIADTLKSVWKEQEGDRHLAELKAAANDAKKAVIQASKEVVHTLKDIGKA